MIYTAPPNSDITLHGSEFWNMQEKNVYFYKGYVNSIKIANNTETGFDIDFGFKHGEIAIQINKEMKQ